MEMLRRRFWNILLSDEYGCFGNQVINIFFPIFLIEQFSLVKY